MDISERDGRIVIEPAPTLVTARSVMAAGARVSGEAGGPVDPDTTFDSPDQLGTSSAVFNAK